MSRGGCVANPFMIREPHHKRVEDGPVKEAVYSILVCSGDGVEFSP